MASGHAVKNQGSQSPGCQQVEGQPPGRPGKPPRQGGFLVLLLHVGDNPVDAGLAAAVIVPISQPLRHRIGDVIDVTVSEEVDGPASGGEVGLPVVHVNEEQHTIGVLPHSEAVVIVKVVGIVPGGLALSVAGGHQRKVKPRPSTEIPDLGGQSLFLTVGEEVCKVVDLLVQIQRHIPVRVDRLLVRQDGGLCRLLLLKHQSRLIGQLLHKGGQVILLL